MDAHHAEAAGSNTSRKPSLSPAGAFSVLPLAHGNIRIYVNVPQPLLPEADFCWQQRDTLDNDAASSEMDLWSMFLATILRLKPNEQVSAQSRHDLLQCVFQQYHYKFIGPDGDIHCVAKGMPRIEALINTYNNVRTEVLRAQGAHLDSLIAYKGVSTLVREARAGHAGIFVQFAGQGSSDYFVQLRTLYHSYPTVRRLVSHVASRLVEQETANEARALGFFKQHGMDIISWLKHTQHPSSASSSSSSPPSSLPITDSTHSRVPPDEYLMSAPVSYPLILLTQLCQYLATVEGMMKGDQGDPISHMRSLIKGATGHSQGIAAAVVVSCSPDIHAFERVAGQMVVFLFWIGCRTQETYFRSDHEELQPALIEESVASGDGRPSPLMSVHNISLEALEKQVNSVNDSMLEPSRRVSVSLVNGLSSMVLSGPPKSLYVMRMELQKLRPKKGEDQSRLPYSLRKPDLWTYFLPVTVPFHNSLFLEAATQSILADLSRLKIDFSAQDLATPVYSTQDGKDLRAVQGSLSQYLIELQTILPVVWSRTIESASTSNGITHVLDFGPGVGVAKMSARIKEGTGVQVISAEAIKYVSSSVPVLDKTVLFSTAPLSYATDWSCDFGPRLVRLHDDSLAVDTSFTRLVGKPPVMVAGMTPTTANEHIVAAFTNAGYHGELAAGGLPRERIMRECINNLMERLNDGEGVALNMLFLNSKLWGFQFPLVTAMRQEGIPIDSITIAAGVPSLGKSNEIIAELQASGISYVAYKPGSVSAIRDVVEVASHNPTMTILIQWTGGRGGGHHSAEDFYLPILETYGLIRQHKNIVLVAGSGIGDSSESVMYLRGTWSAAFGRPPMPFDAVLVASRIMVAREALTSDEVKELLIATPGVDKEHEWVRSYDAEAGGVMSVVSELGEPIHKVATRGMKMWGDFDKKYFKLPAPQMEAAIMNDKDTIIHRLNADFQKVYFGRKASGVVAEVQEMTYAEVLERMVALMYVTDKKGSPVWIHESFAARVTALLTRLGQRFGRRNAGASMYNSNHHVSESEEAPSVSVPPSVLSTVSSAPHEALRQVFALYPRARTQLMSGEDCDFFIDLCKGPGKPVNFVPVIDKDLSFWIKKDSLWYSEMLEAVPGRDVGRVAVLQGPVAVRHSTKPNEPIADILGGISKGIIQDLLNDYPNKEAIPYMEYIGGAPIRRVTQKDLPSAITIQTTTNEKEGSISTVIQLPNAPDHLPNEELWREFLAGGRYSWWRGLLCTRQIVRGKCKVDNPIIRLFHPRPGQRVEVVRDTKGNTLYVHVWDASGTSPSSTPTLKVTRDDDAISVTISHFRPPSQHVPLTLRYLYRPLQGYAPIHEVSSSNDLIKRFYAQLWFGEVPEDMHAWSTEDSFETTKIIAMDDITKFCTAIGARARTIGGRVEAPVDFAIVACWEPLVRTLFPQNIDTDLLTLLHLTYGYTLLDSHPLYEGDTVRSKVKISEVVNLRNPNGKRVSVKGILSREDHAGSTPLIEVTSQFLFRGTFHDFENTFRTSPQIQRRVELHDPQAKSILESKPWLVLDKDVHLEVGDRLLFCVTSRETFHDEHVLREVHTTGDVLRYTGQTSITTRIGTVQFSGGDVLVGGDPIRGYLDRHGQPLDPVQFFEDGGYSMVTGAPFRLMSPKENNTYSAASGDYNPIHTNPYIAGLANLPMPITHGMYTAALARNVLQKYAVTKHQHQSVQCVTNYHAQFVDMVFPNDELKASVRHVGCKNGKKLVEVEISAPLRNAVVLKASAEVTQPVTAYVFTGQGSAEPGMGMDLYASSRVAKAIWDSADTHLMMKFGFSILEIVKRNPKTLVVHFGGPKGALIRDNYLALKSEVTVEVEGGRTVTQVVSLFPGIKDTTESYTFQHPQGLLFATQFTQPALTLLEKSAFEDMKTTGLTPGDAIFAGHSLGEYAALASIANVLSVEALVELVFMRGITMQNAVARDDRGRSSFAMAAVSPPRVGPFFTQEHLHKLVDEICAQSGKLLEVVNYNVQDFQYIVTGHISNLKVLDAVLGDIKKAPHKAIQEAPANIAKHIAFFLQPANAASPLERGVATIPLPGVDVPFHSRYLLGGVPRFREYLMMKIKPEDVDVQVLEGKYIPNLVARPFSLTKEYAQSIYDITQSKVYKAQVLDVWDEAKEDKQLLAYRLLIELLAYQFASPVRWIETQDVMFRGGVERVVEIGPVSTLIGMANRTLAQGKYPPFPPKELLAFSSDRDAIYYQILDQDTSSPPTQDTPPKPVQVAAPVAVVAPSPAPVAASGGSVGSVSDAPVSAFDALQVMLALKLNRTLDEVPGTKSVKELVGGKSAVQNEILGELQKEFGAEPEGAAEMQLTALAQAMGPTYSKLGGQTSKLVARLVSTKMPGGFGFPQAKAYLASDHGLGDGRVEGALLYGLTMAPDDRLATDAAAKQWLDKVVEGYARSKGLSLSRGSAGQAGPSSVVVVDSAALKMHQSKLDTLMRHHMQALSAFLDDDARGELIRALDAEVRLRTGLEAELSLFNREHGRAYMEGVAPLFEPRKERRFNSDWNWGRQECFELFFDAMRDNPVRFGPDYCQRVISLINRSIPEVLEVVEALVVRARTEGNVRVAQHVSRLAESVRSHLDQPPMFRILSGSPTAPSVTVGDDGKISFGDVPRPQVDNFMEFVKEMSRGFDFEMGRVKEKDMTALPAFPCVAGTSSGQQQTAPSVSAKKPKVRTAAGAPLLRRAGRIKRMKDNKASKSGMTHDISSLPLLFVTTSRTDDPAGMDPALTGEYFRILSKFAENGLTFHRKVCLVTGCGRDSIGLELVKGLLAGGATVIATTSRFSKQTSEMYRDVYQKYGAKDSELVLYPFNQGSLQDVNALVDHIYERLNLDLDLIVPFAAVSEAGRDISGLDSVSELSHRVMLTNLLRMLGRVKTCKEARGIDTKPTHVLLPLSPNHGIFGFDGLYSESKLALESLFNRWESEGWQNFLSLTGAVIGWTRGTGLMSGNNMVAQGIEARGVRTFSQVEMSFALLGLLSREMVLAAQKAPLWADLSGHMKLLKDLKSVVDQLRADIMLESRVRSAVAADARAETSMMKDRKDKGLKAAATNNGGGDVHPKANFEFSFPSLPDPDRLSSLRSRLEGMVDLEKVVVIVGMGEVGPWGNSRTRWEMEARGEFSLEGCIELAWSMGLIKYKSSVTRDGTSHTGWVDARTEEPVPDHQVKARYEDHILAHTGIRIVEPDLFGGYDPNRKEFLHEIAITSDLEPVAVQNREEAEHFLTHHGPNKCVISEGKDGQWMVQLRKGAVIHVPKAMKFDRFVAGQVPTGWDATRCGVPKDIVDQVDTVTLYNLVSTAEALVSAGICDPYELYEYCHVSEVGNTCGGGMGGQRSIRATFRNRYMEHAVQGDILQELFINTMPAWVNLLLLSSSGPIKTPVGACATAAQSVEIGVETIRAGKAKIVLVGGYDDFSEEGSYEFAQMKATSNSEEEVKMGREPGEMSRPTTSTRAGFMESQGAGTQVLASADIAIKMGLPILGIVALANTATDKEGRSIPAPGKGILTTARESHSTKTANPMLDVAYRRRQLAREQDHIARWKQEEIDYFNTLLQEQRADLEAVATIRDKIEFVEQQAERRRKASLSVWGSDFFANDPSIAPLRGALAVYGLTPDDLGVASFHGTSTKANDFNESDVLHSQLSHLGRTKGNPVLSVFQKWLTGHPKGAAAAWMLNGVVQSILSGLVPGNRNADNIDPKMKQFTHIVYNSRTIHTSGIKAGILKSFGFGQAGAEIVVVHPDYILATLPPSRYDAYVAKRHGRMERAYIYQHRVLTNKHTLIKVKTAPPYSSHDESSVYLNPTARASYDSKDGTWRFSQEPRSSSSSTLPSTSPAPAPSSPSPSSRATGESTPSSRRLEVTIREMAEGMRQPYDRGIGVDCESTANIDPNNADFITRNFTEAEIAYCRSKPSPNDVRACFTGRWAAKEAIIKAVSSAVPEGRPLWKGAAAPVKGIEVLPSSGGAPVVVFHDHAREVVTALGLVECKVSITHCGDYAIAQAVIR